MKRPLITDDAKEDFANIKAYLKREASQKVANAVAKKIKDAIAFLGRNPGAGHLREDLTDLPLKFWTVGAYIIIYAPTQQPIEIIRIMHGHQDIPPALPRGNGAG